VDYKTQARILIEVEKKNLKRTFSELIDTYGPSVKNIPEIIFEEIANNGLCSVEEIKKMFSSYVEWINGLH